MTFLYALYDRSVDELIEFFPSQETAEETVAETLADEPHWREVLDVILVEFADSPN
ncbi:MAG TPA: hypothetical protein VIM33_12685 [Gaiellaceae bacterium]|jgi:hypothetical protein